jgi:hypothetical protein
MVIPDGGVIVFNFLQRKFLLAAKRSGIGDKFLVPFLALYKLSSKQLFTTKRCEYCYLGI